MTQNARVVAVLGPTNTGKTHYAIERMLGYRTGVIGLPLRLFTEHSKQVFVHVHMNDKQMRQTAVWNAEK